MEPGYTVAVNDWLAPKFEKFMNVGILIEWRDWYCLEENISTIFTTSVDKVIQIEVPPFIHIHQYSWVKFSYSYSSPVDAFILIKFNIHDGVSITGFPPHIGAIWHNQMCWKWAKFWGSNFTVISWTFCIFIVLIPGSWVVGAYVAPNSLLWLTHPARAVTVNGNYWLCKRRFSMCPSLKETNLHCRRDHICLLWWSSIHREHQSPWVHHPCTPARLDPRCLGCSQRDQHSGSRRPYPPYLGCCRLWWHMTTPGVLECQTQKA